MRVFRGPSESEGFFVCVSYAMSGQVDHTVGVMMLPADKLSSAGLHGFQCGATEWQAWNERIYLASIIWFRLRRAEQIRSPRRPEANRIA